MLGVVRPWGWDMHLFPLTTDPAYPVAAHPLADAGVEPGVDAASVSRVSATFRDTKSRTGDPLISAAYSQLQCQSDRMFSALTGPREGVRVVFTPCRRPYLSDQELIGAVKSTRVLEVTSAAVDGDRRHPQLGCETGGPYDRFRAVHDLVGHVAFGYGFDQEGEYHAWRAQCSMFSGLARWALATELHGENSVLCDTGQIAEHKAILLPPDLLLRSYRGRLTPAAYTRTHPLSEGQPTTLTKPKYGEGTERL
jgi:hypothetical protein